MTRLSMSLRQICMIALLAAANLLSPPATQAEPPDGFRHHAAPQATPVYRVIESPHRGERYDVRQRTPYRYGWFGSQRHTHWRHHHGYHQDYSQWSR